MKKKSNQAYKTISEAAIEVGLVNSKNKKPNTHTLRFWEKNFKQIKPKVLNGNRRYYSNKDIYILKLIHQLLKNKGLTISGAKKVLNNDTIKLDQTLFSDIKDKNFKDKIKNKAIKIKSILNRLKNK